MRLTHKAGDKGMGGLFDQLRKGEIIFFPDVYFNAHDSISEFPDVPAWVRAIGFPLHDSNGKPEKFVLMHEDITERKQTEAELQNSKEHYRAIVDAYDGLIYICSQDHNILYLNEKMIEKIGRNAVGEPCFKALHDLDEVCPWCVNDRIKNGESVQWEVQSPKDNRWYYVVNTPIYYEDGTISKQAMIQDITERKQGEIDKIHLESQLHQAQKMESVGRLAGGVAHDFNNLLTVILGGAHLALSELEPGQPLHEYVTQIKKAGEKSADLTQQLLAFAQKQTIEPKILDLNDSVSGMLKMLQRLIGENTQLAWLPSNNLWAVKADPSQIDQILANLCVNARDSITDIGTITIRTGNSVVDDGYRAEDIDVVPGEYVHISVCDTGCGMDKETLAHIFEPFFTTKGPGDGTGLGLATVYGAAKQNNGFVNVYSEPGIGTTFTIYLPRYVGNTDQMSVKDPTQPAPKGLDTILLVEDEPAILNMVTMLLQKQGYTVLTAGTPGEATRLANEHSGKIDLLITDVIMPEMNGKDLAHNLMSFNPKLKCLFMSGYTADAISHHGVLEEGVHFIHKPFSLPDLATKVRTVIDGK
jgi:PAS domain S-box-containing protein